METTEGYKRGRTAKTDFEIRKQGEKQGVFVIPGRNARFLPKTSKFILTQGNYRDDCYFTSNYLIKLDLIIIFVDRTIIIWDSAGSFLSQNGTCRPLAVRC